MVTTSAQNLVVIRKQLGDVVEFIDGDRGKNYPKQNEFFDSGYCLFLSTKNVPKNSFSFEEKMFVTEEKDNKLRKGKLQRGDYVLTTRGTVGNFAYYNEKVPFENVRINSGMVVLRVKSADLNRDYFKFYLETSSFREQVNGRVSGSAQPQLPIRDMLTMVIDLPDVKTQTAIASVLSTYDDLIEKNEKRIRVLEEMAQQLYTEWFVRFLFPGHEKKKMVDSGIDYGKIPEGWKVKRFDEVIRIVRGRSYSSEQISDSQGDYYIVNLKSFNRGGGFRLDGAKYYSGIVNANQLLEHGDIVVAVTDMTNDRAVIARPARIPNILTHKTTLSADVVKIVPTEIPSTFIYYCLLDHRFTEATKNKANGANVLHLKPSAIAEYRALIPSNNLLMQFDVLCKPSIDLIDKTMVQNADLEKMRDLLIPQLVTGKRILKIFS